MDDLGTPEEWSPANEAHLNPKNNSRLEAALLENGLHWRNGHREESLVECAEMEWAEVVEIELRRGGPKSYCLLIPTIAPPMSDSSTNLSDIVQSRRRGDQVSVRGGPGGGR